ncbi:GIY-YIG nuclease family protein [Dysgonomonas sp. 25]|uniref:GIY-YIG nuclease family protein n=1 Tax=Dysgonomonas sp. 25 TaxID=2302933 RepID=UPI0013D37CE1|nr:GIY-YIG nuclease family protein [Dysgonomonas sp. 25]NDV69223.1 GIY-YIG nuclease family protein [Dysgonomonas sp. 25]
MPRPLGMHNYFVYIVTNKNKYVLYIGVTNNLRRRLYEHEFDGSIAEDNQHFTHKYKTHYLIYWERFGDIQQAIAREKEIKGWRRSKKEKLISEFNPEWVFLNDEVE